MKKIFGYFSFYNINKERKLKQDLFFDNPEWKTKWILRYNAPKWLWKHLESISFDNLYRINRSGEKRTALIFTGSKNIYWIFFRKTPYEGAPDWKWCLKFQKSTNDHCCCG